MATAQDLDALDLGVEFPGLAREGRDVNETTQMAMRSAALSPRFYTTDIAALNQLSVERVRREWDALMTEFGADNNKNHFERDGEVPWDLDRSRIPEPLYKEFVDFLVSSLTSEFSGCVLYAELRKRGTNPDLCQLFKYMARDESRHAGFINESLRDFGISVDLGLLAKKKEYTFFKPKFILYATYLSEKIGYARYIKIFRHLERHPEHRFHPLFKWFQQWCNDEFRHGEALALMMRAQPGLLRGHNKLWIRFFQLAVFATMFVRDHTRVEFHKALGIEIERYDMEVIRLTVEISKQVFPVLLDVEHPAFLEGLRAIQRASAELDGLPKTLSGKLRALPLRAAIVSRLVRLYLLPTVKNALPSDMRVQPVW
jgi:magnesium-protoporphyrin IX monomethyl ester (oxidative) cyclase